MASIVALLVQVYALPILTASVASSAIRSNLVGLASPSPPKFLSMGKSPHVTATAKAMLHVKRVSSAAMIAPVSIAPIAVLRKFPLMTHVKAVPTSVLVVRDIRNVGRVSSATFRTCAVTAMSVPAQLGHPSQERVLTLAANVLLMRIAIQGASATQATLVSDAMFVTPATPLLWATP